MSRSKMSKKFKFSMSNFRVRVFNLWDLKFFMSNFCSNLKVLGFPCPISRFGVSNFKVSSLPCLISKFGVSNLWIIGLPCQISQFKISN